MASPEPPILPPVPEVEPPPPLTAEIARPAAYATLSSVQVMMGRLSEAISMSRQTADTWEDEFWSVSGYDKAAVMAALDELDKMVADYESNYADDAAVLATQMGV